MKVTQEMLDALEIGNTILILAVCAAVCGLYIKSAVEWWRK